MQLRRVVGFTVVLGLIATLIVGWTLAWLVLSPEHEPESICGNGIRESAETEETCCQDTGCPSDEACSGKSCASLECSYCEYAANNTCNKYECCINSDCKKTEACVSHKCSAIKCECGYIQNNSCTSYECCNGFECASGVCQSNKCASIEAIKQLETSPQSVSASKGSSKSSKKTESLTAQTQAQQELQQQAQQGCASGEERSCGLTEQGECSFGAQSCSNGQWGSCQGEISPAPEACDSKDNDCDSSVDEGNPCGAGQACIQGACKVFDVSYKVQPVIFFASDYATDSGMVSYLEDKFEELRQFYLNKVGLTFTMLEPQIVSGANNHGWYWCVDGQANCVANNFEANIIRELKGKGFPVEEDWNAYPKDRITWVAVFGGGGYAGGRQYPTGGGFAMVGDAGIYAAKENSCTSVLDKYFSTDSPPNVKAHCLDLWLPSGKQYGFGIGALGHELGHALGVPHPDGYSGTTSQDWENTILGYHWNYPNTGLLKQDKSILNASKYFNAVS